MIIPSFLSSRHTHVKNSRMIQVRSRVVGERAANNLRHQISQDINKSIRASFCCGGSLSIAFADAVLIDNSFWLVEASEQEGPLRVLQHGANGSC